MSVAKLIPTIELFAKLPANVLEQFTKMAKVHYYKKGTEIFNSSASQKFFIYVLKGWVKISRDVVDGSEVILDILNNGHSIGEHFLLETESQPYHAEAISDLELFIIPIDFLRRLVNENHQFTLNLLNLTLQRQQKLTLEMEHLSIQSATQRIGCFLLRLCTIKKMGNTSFRLPYDKSLLASRLGMRAETFSRALAKICQECELKSDDDTLQINAIDKLVHYVCQHCSQTYPCKDIMR